jgi:glutaredoxin
MNLHPFIDYQSGIRETWRAFDFKIPDVRLRRWGEKMKKQLFLLLALIVMSAGPANADFYTWKDESGVSHITDYPPPKNLKIKAFEGSNKPAEQPTVQKEKKPEIILYTKNNCPDCDKARVFLTAKELAFTEYNIDQDETAVAKRKAIDDSNTVPFAVIDRYQIDGFSETAYNRALKTSP